MISFINKNNKLNEVKNSLTITYPRTITSITTQITDPSGELSNLSPNSSILYKIQKSKTSNAQILQQVLQANKKK